MSVRVAISPSERFEILTRDKFTCRYCGRKSPNVELHVDHIHPVAKGGTNSPDNLCAACVECNLSKKDKLIGQHLPMPADDAPLAERVAHLKLEMKRRFADYDEKVPAKAFSLALEADYSLSSIVKWFDDNTGRLRFVDAAIQLVDLAAREFGRRDQQKAGEREKEFVALWGRCLKEALTEGLENYDESLWLDPVDDDEWRLEAAHLCAEALGQEEFSELSHTFWRLFERALSRGVRRVDLLIAVVNSSYWQEGESISAIVALMLGEPAEEEPSPSLSSPSVLSLVQGGDAE